MLADALEEMPASGRCWRLMFAYVTIAAHLCLLRWMIYDECSKKQKDFKEKLRDGA